ncbi:cadherin-87A-like [Watersipora subatra]|uniref:cadherin-87A-like n=1 Tax=Watersipora subatra TaxID=2589382 RepID=UPI00355C3706
MINNYVLSFVLFTRLIIRLILIFLYLFTGSFAQLVNSPPEFASSPSSFDVNENEKDKILTTLRATDPDGDPISFNIDIDDYFKIEAVDANTVNVVSTRGIDYERNSQIEFAVTATDENSNSMTRKDISVNVRDTNDNTPLFAQGGSSSFVIAEAEEVGYRLRNAFTVTDADTGSNAETDISCYVDPSSEESREACNTFDLEPRQVSNGNYSVDIVIKTPLDFETKRSYIMTVEAINTASPFNLTRKNFVINILDSQDRLPVFLRAPYSPSPWEELAVGSVIDVVSIRDGDREAQPPRRIVLDLLNDTRGWLDLSPLQNNSGIFESNLTVRSRMDREEFHQQAVYTVAIKGSELFPNGSIDETASTLSYITVQIFDINDNAPEFYTGALSDERLIAPLVLDVEEGLGVNTNLPGFLLSVIDIDIPPNNQFSVEMTGFGSDTFQLSPQYGTGSAVLSLAVKKEANLDFEKPEYRYMELIITARDTSESVNLTRSATVVINLLDVNDNSPYFEQGVYTQLVNPDVQPGSLLLTVTATDPDSGVFGRLTYTIDASDIVRIDNETGSIYLVSDPSENAGARFEFELLVTDGGGRFSTAVFVVNFDSEFPYGPRFDSHIYNASVYENRTMFLEQPVRVRATSSLTAIDEDSEIVTYRIIAGNTADDAFQLHPSSGVLTLRRPLLKQDGRQFDLTIEASDGQLNDTAKIVVILLDSNDYTPRFQSDTYRKRIPESTPIGSNVVNISVTDEDDSDEPGGQITFMIISGDNSQRFYVNPLTGEMTVNSGLDYDAENNFAIQVKAEDGGVPRRSATATVYIELTDINNKLPRFYTNPYIQYLSESTPIGSKVIQVNAFDLDTGSELRYDILPGNFTATDQFGISVDPANFDFMNAFAINSLNGEITTRLPFDENIVSRISFVVRARDIQGEEPRLQEGFAQVQITIREDGVGTPLFLNEPWTLTNPRIVVNVSEESTGLILRLVAVDSETGEVISTFREVAGDPDNFFNVEINGEVHLLKELDYEELEYEEMFIKKKEIVVEAVTASGQASSATLQVNVIDINDNMPVFSRDTYIFSLREQTYHQDTPFDFLSATDADKDTTLYYKLTGQYSYLFYIDDQHNIGVRNGTVIDAELTDQYDLQVEVSDDLQGGHTTSTTVTIIVTNTNEHPPVCLQPTSTFFVPKTAGLGTIFGQILASDADLGDAVRYNLISDDFRIDSTRGTLYTAVSMAYAQQSIYQLTVTLRDSISPYKEAQCQLTIVVTEEQPSNFIFSVPEYEGDSYSLQEESPKNVTIVIVEVRNPDYTRPTGVVYSLANTTDSKYFGIDPETGRVYVNYELDREHQQVYELIVVAHSGRLEASRKFYINLSDVDDNGPDFSCHGMPDPLILSVAEQETNAEKVIGQVLACDPDDYPNNKIYYYLVSCEDGSSTDQWERFSIDIETGEISVNSATVDYEESKQHVICVNASSSRVDASVWSVQRKVIVDVVDINDHELYFTHTSVSAVITANVGTGQTVVMIEATDEDDIAAGELTYEIVSIEYIRGDLTVSGSQNETIRSAFSIDRLNGKVATNLPNYISLVGGRFLLKIKAQTTIESADMTLIIFVNDPNEQLILVIDRSPEEVSTFIDDFFSDLNEIHNVVFVIQHIEYHSINNTQQTDLNMTDIYFYVVDEDGNLVNSSYVEEILQAGYNARQDELFADSDVVTGGSKYSRQTSRVEMVSWADLEWIWLLILISACMLFIDAIILICCLFYFHDKYITTPPRKNLQPLYVK